MNKRWTGQCPHLPFSERGLSPIRSAWPGNTLEIVKPLVLAERCELGQLALRANEDTGLDGHGLTPPNFWRRLGTISHELGRRSQKKKPPCDPSEINFSG
jgi:hypothetical protein